AAPTTPPLTSTNKVRGLLVGGCIALGERLPRLPSEHGSDRAAQPHPLLRAPAARGEPVGPHHRTLPGSLSQPPTSPPQRGRGFTHAARGALQASLAAPPTRRSVATAATRYKHLKRLY